MKRIFALFIFLALALSFCACAKGTPTWQEQYDLGLRYLSEGNYQEAIIAFTAAIEIDPMRPEAYLRAAEAYEAVGDSEAARDILEKGYTITEDSSLSPRESIGQGVGLDELGESEDNDMASEDEPLLPNEELNFFEPPEETPQEWIIDDFISPEELTIGNIPFYKTNIYAASEVYPNGQNPPAPVTNGTIVCMGNPEFRQSPESDVLSIVSYGNYIDDFYRNYQPEFREIRMGMPTIEVLQKLGFTEFAIQKILNFSENGIEYNENNINSVINIIVEKTQISVYNGGETLMIRIILSNADEEGIDMDLGFNNNNLSYLQLHDYNMYIVHYTELDF